MFTAGLSDDLLHPPSHGSHWRIRKDRELVSAHQSGLCDESAQCNSGVTRGGHICQRLFAHAVGIAEKKVKVHAEQSGGDQAEISERGEPSAHIRVGVENFTEAAFVGKFFERSAGVGGDDEA